MTRVTFQFIPINPSVEFEYSPIWESVDVTEVKTEDGFTIACLSDGSQIEYDIQGDLRFTFVDENLSADNLNSLFQVARGRIKEIFGESSEVYTVCLLLNDKDVISTFLGATDTIEEFGSKYFDTKKISHTELGRNTVKVSFRKNRELVSI